MRRSVATLALALCAGATVTAGCGETRAPTGSASAAPSVRAGAWVRAFRSRPDLQPPAVRLRRRDVGTAPGLIFLGSILGPGQRGPLVVDDRGEPVWFRPVPLGQVATDVRVQSYRGRPVLTWWQGRYHSGHGCGVGKIADTSYRVIATVRPTGPGSTCPDLHEFELTPRGTALMLAYPEVRRGGRRLLDGVVEEVDIPTGRVLFRWSALEHVGLSESYRPRPAKAGAPIDYFHINAVDRDASGDLLVTARHTWTVYRIDGRTGEIKWRLGGKRSTFSIPRAARFSWPHDARFSTNGTISIFDNAAGDSGRTGLQSSGKVFRLNESAGRASLRAAFRHSPRAVAISQANVQRLPGGHVFIGWGWEPFVSEYAPDGRQVLDLRLPPRGGSYRAYRLPWSGRPTDAPALAVRRSGSGATANMSWNGATDVARWDVLVGDDPSSLRSVALVARGGFETTAPIPSEARYVRVRALNASGETLRMSKTVSVG